MVNYSRNIKLASFVAAVFGLVAIYTLIVYERQATAGITEVQMTQDTVSYICSETDKCVQAETVRTEERRARGLSGRTSLDHDKGMWFVFDEQGFYNFWMKDMLFPIDIIWVNDKYEIVFVHEYVQPESYPETFNPMVPVKYVLEVASGNASRYGFTSGSLVDQRMGL